MQHVSQTSTAYCVLHTTNTDTAHCTWGQSGTCIASGAHVIPALHTGSSMSTCSKSGPRWPAHSLVATWIPCYSPPALPTGSQPVVSPAVPWCDNWTWGLSLGCFTSGLRSLCGKITCLRPAHPRLENSQCWLMEPVLQSGKSGEESVPPLSHRDGARSPGPNSDMQAAGQLDFRRWSPLRV